MNVAEKTNSFMARYYKLFFTIAFCIAMLLRFIGLGHASLNDSEAQNALQALSIVRGQSTVIGGHPGFIGLTTLLFFLFRDSTFFARFWPALFGTILVLTPLLFRKQLNDTSMILLAFLLAFEPGLVALSRTADGLTITITALVAAIGFYLNKKFIPAGILVGLSLISSERFWLISILILLAGGCTYFLADKKGRNTIASGLKIEASHIWVILLSAVTTIVLISTQFLLFPKGISGVGTGLADSLRVWQQIETLEITTYLLIYLTTQFPTLILGIWGLVNGLRKHSNLARFMGLYFVIGLLFSIFNPARDIWNIVLCSLPIYILACEQILNFIEGVIVQSIIVTVIEGIVTISLFVFSIMNFLNMVNFPLTDPTLVRNRLIGTLLPLMLWIAFTTLLAWGWDAVSTKSGLLAGLGILFCGILLGSALKATDLGTRPENELLSDSGYISRGMDTIHSVQDIAKWTNGVETRIDIDVVGLESSSLMWSIRDFEKITENSTFPVTNTPAVVVSSVESIIQTQTLYRGHMVVWSIQPDYEQMQWRDWIKWFFLREIPQKKEYILLWVRNDLFKDVSVEN